MSLIAEGSAGSALDPYARRSRNIDFRFIPSDLAEKCRRLIESYHAMHGYACLPDMLWHSGTQDFIESHRDFSYIFKNAARTRYAKRADDSFVLIATTIMSIEVLARDFAGWGNRYQAAKRTAEAIILEFMAKPRTWLVDMYLYPQRHIHPAFINPLAAPDQPKDAVPGRDRSG